MLQQQIYDYVIVGGGSAGAVLAARLTEDPETSVLLLEAGRGFDPAAYPEPVYSSNVVGANADPRYEWGYFAEKVGQDAPTSLPRGKVLGGSSAINTAIAIRALPLDFDRWAAKGIRGWSFQDVLPYFKKMETSTQGSDDLRGRSGPFPIHQMSLDYITPAQRATVEAAWVMGYGRVDDFNSPDNNGAGPVPMNVVNGVRVNTGICYLTSAVRARPNLTIFDQVTVDRLGFERRRARTVLLTDSRELRGHQIILCAGSIGSACILMRSGIGPRRELESMGIAVLKEAPVGTALLDHAFYWMNFAGKAELKGLDQPVIAAQLWTNSSYAASASELDIAISPSHMLASTVSSTGVAFSLGLELMNCKSRGTVKLSSRDPGAPPDIRLNHLTDPDDMRRMVECFRIARKLAQTEPLRSLIVEEIFPGALAADSDREITAALSRNVSSLQHPCASARMGTPDDPDAVVDDRGRVYGVDALRVIDASIFPEIPLMHLNPTIIMIAEKLADDLRGIRPAIDK